MNLVTKPFSVENGLLTQKMKLKRNVAKEYFGPIIDDCTKIKRKSLAQKTEQIITRFKFDFPPVQIIKKLK